MYHHTNMRTPPTSLPGVIAGFRPYSPCGREHLDDAGQGGHGRRLYSQPQCWYRTFLSRYRRPAGSPADKKGNYFWIMQIDPLSDRSCVLRASLEGYDSTVHRGVWIQLVHRSQPASAGAPAPRSRQLGSERQHFLRGRNPAGGATALEQRSKAGPEEELAGSRARTANRGPGRAEVHPRLVRPGRRMLEPEQTGRSAGCVSACSGAGS